jgi:hypothetical protein
MVIVRLWSHFAHSYFLDFAAWFRTWFTSDGESRNERAIAAGFMPARWCDN